MLFRKISYYYELELISLIFHVCCLCTSSVGPETPDEEFDFQSKLEEFEKEGDENDDDYDDEAGDSPDGHAAYEKDDFFDSISCDAIDREKGRDNRLRGANERNLNTETFGAVALNSQRRRRGRGGGRGEGRGEGRGGGRGRGRGRGRGGRGGRGRGRYSNSTGVPTASTGVPTASS
jgi:protein LSM14